MTDALEYTPRQSSRSVWVFHLDVPEDELKAWEKPLGKPVNGHPASWPLREALGVDYLDPEHLEVFAVSNISEYGLARYLSDANGFPDDAVAADASKLNGLKGSIALVYSEALGAKATALTPRAPLTFKCRYDTRPDLRISAPIQTESAAGQLPRETQPTQPARMPIWPLALFVGLAVGLIAVLAIPKM